MAKDTVDISIEALKQFLHGPLPGREAQDLMAPSTRSTENRMADPADARPSSVLVLFYQREGQWFIPFIQRPVYDGVHSGQVSFPGGKCEEEDEGHLYTALRETREEIGVIPGEVIPLGALTPLYIPNSNFFVYPHVGWMDKTPAFVPDPLEVEEVIEVTVDRLLDKRYTKTFCREVNEITITAPYFDAGSKKIWGATAMMLSEMLEILKMLERG
ncbi:MAG: CoA pyrophosphatase [Marinilabilia sp.]